MLRIKRRVDGLAVTRHGRFLATHVYDIRGLTRSTALSLWVLGAHLQLGINSLFAAIVLGAFVAITVELVAEASRETDARAQYHCIGNENVHVDLS